jgi:Flp pilus assembly protein TadG
MSVRVKIRREDGAAAVEFALIIGVLAMLIFGMLQFGVAFFELQNLRASSREGARLGAVAATPDAVRTRVEQASNGAIKTGEASNTSFVQVQYSDSGNGPWVNKTGSAAPVCSSTASITTNAAVRVLINLSSAPPRLQDMFTLNIPLLPPITMRPTVDAEFRCEGVKSQ